MTPSYGLCYWRTYDGSGHRCKDINFNITKDGSERQAICTVKFDEDDVAAMVIGAVVLQKRQKYALSKIKEALYGTDDSDKKKLGNLKKIIRTIEF